MPEKQVKEVKINESQRRFLFLNMKDVLEERVLGGKRFDHVFGTTTQAMIREAVYTYCFFKPIYVEETTRFKKTGVTKEGKETGKNIPVYIFRLKLSVPVFGDELLLERKVDKEKFETA
ncbi:MAG: hypothetical protein GVX78_02125 [Bacteroidetes bacterium]|jgi:hypothetical protein|nr:hypothetical protein [Bacteroidota bacterium]